MNVYRCIKTEPDYTDTATDVILGVLHELHVLTNIFA